jgi:hypothetical protein
VAVEKILLVAAAIISTTLQTMQLSVAVKVLLEELEAVD